MIDNTWAAGVLFRALDFGVDISIQAGTKYLIGPLMRWSAPRLPTRAAGTSCVGNAYLMGQMLDADTAYMTSPRPAHPRRAPASAPREQPAHRGMAVWHPQVARVNHPALRAAKGMSSGSATLPAAAACSSFILNKRLNDELSTYLDNFSLFSMATPGAVSNH